MKYSRFSKQQQVLTVVINLYWGFYCTQQPQMKGPVVITIHHQQFTSIIQWIKKTIPVDSKTNQEKAKIFQHPSRSFAWANHLSNFFLHHQLHCMGSESCPHSPWQQPSNDYWLSNELKVLLTSTGSSSKMKSDARRRVRGRWTDTGWVVKSYTVQIDVWSATVTAT